MNLIEALGFRRPDWQADAACREHPEVNFFPERGESTAPAKAICSTCLVADECHQYAIDNGIKDGIWGGGSGRERRTERREASAIVRIGSRGPAPHGCGTPAGSGWHRAHGQTPCDACKAAHAEYVRQRRATRRGAA